MRKPFTLGLTVFGALLCLVHFIGHEYDPIYLLFYSLSVPAWIAPAFGDVTRISTVVIIYLLTIATYTLIGYIIDYSIARIRSGRSAA
ncbi:hypothetical protein ACFFK0_00530 [Paenibacillus chartarius]|uniref:Uncharacterized protein n=1 Tax=Paenibacillus chartarius TaxID=747481 RepID=A0ABV6DE70_9BACL